MSRKSKRTKGKKAAQVSMRSRIVWGAFLGAMTTVGGFFWMLQGGPAPRLDGLALPAMVAAAGPSSIEAVFRTRTPIESKRWQAIVVHHSGSHYGTPATIEAQHRAANINGLGHHFVIGNGSGLDDGEVRVGYRWLDQLPGAHVAGPQGDWYNRNSISVCLVGDGRRRPYTDQQMRRTVQLVSSLAEQLGIPADRIHLHSDLTQTDDPGRFFPEAAFREQIARTR
jgi:N-acetyl-anhydromuramyl-L-alanine amidase AmpD